MSPPFFAEWRQQRRLRQNAAAYVHTLLTEPDQSDVSWLAERATAGDVDRARWELRYARRALGLLTAQRDALDDRTGSIVAREIGESWSADRNVAAGMRHVAERQFNARLRGIAEAIAARASNEPTAARLGRALLAAAGAPHPTSEDVAHAGGIAARYLEQANESLRASFGTASLPENLPPSALRSGRHARAPRD